MTGYTALTKAKDGTMVPLCNGSFLHSQYNPMREAEQFAAQFDDASFFVVLGIGGGYHIAALLRRFPTATVIAVEATEDDLQFISAVPCVQHLLQDSRVHVTTAERCAPLLKMCFRPAEHERFQFCVLRAWERCMGEKAQQAAQAVQEALAEISADFSVQSHFGKLWQRNILENLALVAHASSYVPAPSLSTEKTAAIIAAGPSLDDSIEILSSHRDHYCVIATDTAYPALLRRGIVADAAVSVDAQLVSYEHFFSIRPQTLFVLDLCANPALVRAVARSGAPFTCVETGHPLAQLAACYDGAHHFPHLATGSGTVTIAAAALAAHAGFSTLALFGADFAYSRGKPYTKGCYLDPRFLSRGTRIASTEQRFCALMYRTELTATGNGSTTTLLQSYRRTLRQFLCEADFKQDGNVYRRPQQQKARESVASFDYAAFRRVLATADDETLRTLLLPYIAYLKAHDGRAKSFKENYSLALSKTFVYTKSYEH